MYFRMFSSEVNTVNPRLCERHDCAIERIVVEGRQCGGRARPGGIKSDFPQIVPLDQSEEPLKRPVHEPELPPCHVDRHPPRADDRHVSLRCLP